MADAPNPVQALLQEELVRLLKQGGGLSGGALNITPKGQVAGRVSFKKQGEVQSPVDAAKQRVDILRLADEEAKILNARAEAARRAETVGLAQMAIEDAEAVISKGKLPNPTDLQYARQLVRMANDPTMTTAMGQVDEAIRKLAEAEAEKSVAQIARLSRVSTSVIPDDMKTGIRDHVINTSQPLSLSIKKDLVRQTRRLVEQQEKIAATAGAKLITSPPTAEALSAQMRSAASEAAKATLAGGKGSKILDKTEQVVAKGLAELGKGKTSSLLSKLSKHSGKAAIGGIIGAALLSKFLGGEKDVEAKGDGMPSMQELMVMKAMSDIQTQQGLAESLIGLRSAQAQKAQSQNELQGLQAMKLLQGLSGSSASQIF